MKSREIHLKNRPQGMPEAGDFELVETEVREPGEGEVTVRNLCMSVDPYMRGRMMDRKSYVPPFALGEVMTGGAIGRVVRSRSEDLAEGDHVSSMYGWREAFTCPAGELRRLGELSAPPSAYLGVLGMPGMTAYVGLLEVAALKDGETVFVSGAAGAVGSVVGQIAKIKGCRVVGSAGSAEKIRWLTEDLGFEAAFDYHDGSIPEQLRAAAPDGLDVYFDNVGGDHLQAAIGHMRQFGRIALCGAISVYNATEPQPGPNNLTLAIGLGLTLRGFIVSHFQHLGDRFRADMEQWVASGRVRYEETVMEGVERAPEAFMGLFTGANTGKMIVQLGAD
ncbi:MAG: NADP-dependent oxidoreductase [Acidobacteria bacterium]|nr:MAG: NADP-dependent oxidoreductase [Acidobacteriota bacterium]REK07858.1 MAG: NADP-dependent oxidoreductase [Acidobacteriota bacterium]